MAPSRSVLVLELAFCLAFFINWSIHLSEGAKATEHVYLDHVIYQYSPKFTENCTCKLSFISRMKKSYTSYCNIIKPLTDIRSHVQVFYKYRNGFQPFLVDIWLNVCNYLRNAAGSSGKLMNMVWPKIRQHLTTSQNLTCPFMGRFDIVNLSVNGDFLDNMFAPVGDYLENVTITNSEELVWNGKFYFTIPSGKTIEDDHIMGR